MILNKNIAMINYKFTEEYKKLHEKINKDAEVFFSLSSNFPNSEDFKFRIKEIMASYNGIIGMANTEIRDLQKELDECKGLHIKNLDENTPRDSDKEEPKTLEEKLKNEIIQSAMGKYTIGELWEKLK